MKVVSAIEVDSPRILEFLSQNEKYCVSLFSRFQNREVKMYMIQDVKGNLHGVFSISDGGQILFCIPLENLRDDAIKSRIFNSLREYFARFRPEKLFSVIGEEDGANLFVNSLMNGCGAIPVHVQHYVLMESAECARSGTSKKLQADYPNRILQQCESSDLEKLMPIQKAYEEEEVLAGIQEFNPAVSRFTMKRNLRHGNVYATLVELNSGEKTIVAKASVNAEGKSFVQLGGIYTMPMFRRQGFSKELVDFIVRKKHSENKKTVLFVKRQNFAAQKLYENCGFTPFGQFKICYY